MSGVSRWQLAARGSQSVLRRRILTRQLIGAKIDLRERSDVAQRGRNRPCGAVANRKSRYSVSFRKRVRPRAHLRQKEMTLGEHRTRQGVVP